MTNEAADTRTPTSARSLKNVSVILAAVAFLLNLMIATWLFYETGRLQQLASENEALLDGSDSLSTRLKELEKKLAASHADYRRTMSQFMSIVSQMHLEDAFPVTDGPAIVSSARRLTTLPESTQTTPSNDDPVRLTCYIPPGDHQFIHGFQFDSKRCQLKLPNRVVHPTEPGKIHKFEVSLTKNDGSAVLVISSTSPSSKTTAHAYPLGDNNVSIRFQSGQSCYMVPNENPRTPDLLEYEIPWNLKSDLPNQILRLEITDGKNSFNLRIGVESDTPASASALILASRSREFLQRISGEYMPPSDAEVALKWMLPGLSQPVPERTPRFDEIFEPPDNSGRLIYRNGWAAKTLEPY